MGIQGLLPVLKPITKAVHISAYAGKKVAIDGYSWLHKAVYSCSMDLVLGRYTDKFVSFCVNRVDMFRQNGVEPIIVFDGAMLPTKAAEEESRRQARETNRERALAMLQSGNVSGAEQAFQRAVDVSPAMAKQVIEEMRSRSVRCLVAPYEADAQMAYLAIHGEVHAVVTEDSDLLVYGCPRVLFKLGKDGYGEEVQLQDLPLIGNPSFAGFTQEMFQELCIFSGCDFLGNLPGIGIKKAHGHLKKLKSFTKVVKSLRFEGRVAIPDGYEQGFQRAKWVFRHQRVYCHFSKTCVHLRPLPNGGLDAADVDVPSALPKLGSPGPDGQPIQDVTEFLGPHLEPDIVQGIAEGRLDPFSKQQFDVKAIYAGCRNPPQSVRHELGLGAKVDQHHWQHQQHHQTRSYGVLADATNRQHAAKDTIYDHAGPRHKQAYTTLQELAVKGPQSLGSLPGRTPGSGRGTGSVASPAQGAANQRGNTLLTHVVPRHTPVNPALALVQSAATSTPATPHDGCATATAAYQDENHTTGSKAMSEGHHKDVIREGGTPQCASDQPAGKPASTSAPSWSGGSRSGWFRKKTSKNKKGNAGTGAGVLHSSGQGGGTQSSIPGLFAAAARRQSQGGIAVLQAPFIPPKITGKDSDRADTIAAADGAPVSGFKAPRSQEGPASGMQDMCPQEAPHSEPSELEQPALKQAGVRARRIGLQAVKRDSRNASRAASPGPDAGTDEGHPACIDMTKDVAAVEEERGCPVSHTSIAPGAGAGAAAACAEQPAAGTSSKRHIFSMFKLTSAKPQGGLLKSVSVTNGPDESRTAGKGSANRGETPIADSIRQGDTDCGIQKLTDEQPVVHSSEQAGQAVGCIQEAAQAPDLSAEGMCQQKPLDQRSSHNQDTIPGTCLPDSNGRHETGKETSDHYKALSSASPQVTEVPDARDVDQARHVGCTPLFSDQVPGASRDAITMTILPPKTRPGGVAGCAGGGAVSGCRTGPVSALMSLHRAHMSGGMSQGTSHADQWPSQGLSAISTSDEEDYTDADDDQHVQHDDQDPAATAAGRRNRHSHRSHALRRSRQVKAAVASGGGGAFGLHGLFSATEVGPHANDQPQHMTRQADVDAGDVRGRGRANVDRFCGSVSTSEDEAWGKHREDIENRVPSHTTVVMACHGITPMGPSRMLYDLHSPLTTHPSTQRRGIQYQADQHDLLGHGPDLGRMLQVEGDTSPCPSRSRPRSLQLAISPAGHVIGISKPAATDLRSQINCQHDSDTALQNTLLGLDTRRQPSKDNFQGHGQDDSTVDTARKRRRHVHQSLADLLHCEDEDPDGDVFSRHQSTAKARALRQLAIHDHDDLGVGRMERSVDECRQPVLQQQQHVGGADQAGLSGNAARTDMDDCVLYTRKDEDSDQHIYEGCLQSAGQRQPAQIGVQNTAHGVGKVTGGAGQVEHGEDAQLLGSGHSFHSVGHMDRYTDIAARAMDNIVTQSKQEKACASKRPSPPPPPSTQNLPPSLAAFACCVGKVKLPNEAGNAAPAAQQLRSAWISRQQAGQAPQGQRPAEQNNKLRSFTEVLAVGAKAQGAKPAQKKSHTVGLKRPNKVSGGAKQMLARRKSDPSNINIFVSPVATAVCTQDDVRVGGKGMPGDRLQQDDDYLVDLTRDENSDRGNHTTKVASLRGFACFALGNQAKRRKSDTA